MPQFLEFKKRTRLNLTELLNMWNSPVRGKSYKHVIDQLLEKQELREDPEVAQLGVPEALSSTMALHSKLKDYVEKKIPLWQFRTTYKGSDWVATLDELDTLQGQWKEAVENVKSLLTMLREFQACDVHSVGNQSIPLGQIKCPNRLTDMF